MELDRIPFENQEYVIGKILTTGHKYNSRYLIDAPSGCGKTELLLELERRFNDPKKSGLDMPFKCAYVDVRNGSSRSTIDKIFRKLDFDLPSNIEDAGEDLASWMIDYQNKNQDIGGFILLIDLSKGFSNEFLEDIVNEFISGVWDGLQKSPLFKDSAKIIRFVLAGCNLASHDIFNIEFNVEDIYMKYTLRSFSFQHLLSSAKKYLKETSISDEVIKDICVSIYHLSGGHLRCIQRLLHLYKNPPRNNPINLSAEKFLKRYESNIHEIIDEETVKFKKSIPDELQDILEYVGCFRSIDNEIIEYLVKKPDFKGDPENIWDNIDKLLQNYLFSDLDDETPIFVNNYHRVYSLDLRQDPENSIFVQDACFHVMEDPKLKNHYHYHWYWAVEYWYHFLQSKFGELESIDSRKKISEDFFGVEVPKIMGVLGRNAIKGVVERFLPRKLKNDLDFQFMINYSLKGDSYNDEIFKRLLKDVNAYFKVW